VSIRACDIRLGAHPVRSTVANMSSNTTDALAGSGEAHLATSRDQQLLADHLAQVDLIARQIHRRLPRHVLVEDLVNAGVLGLMDAIQKFDPNKHVQFKSYAKFRIRGAILDSLRELDWGSRALRRRAREISEVENRVSTLLQRTPTQAELAQELKMDLSEFQSLVAEIQGLEITNFVSGSRFEDCDKHSEGEVPAAVDDTPYFACLRSEMNDVLDRLLANMPLNERRVLRLYYFEELTMQEIGHQLGVGESRVSQIHASALCRLRAQLQSLTENANAVGPYSRCAKHRNIAPNDPARKRT
jgi:RNA polymerase sigma factor FliA